MPYHNMDCVSGKPRERSGGDGLQVTKATKNFLRAPFALDVSLTFTSLEWPGFTLIGAATKSP